MTDQELQGGGQAVWSVVLGPGARLAGIERLARAASAEADPGVAVAFERLSDLAGLLASRGGRGRLVLDADHLPLEDLGFVRRFLAGAPGWSLLLVGDDAGHRVARTALALERTRWLSWPPDLAQLEELVAAPAELRPARAARSQASAAPAAAPPSTWVAHLSELAELAERALQASGTPRPGAGNEPETTGELARLARLARSLAYSVDPPRRSAEGLDLGALLEDLLAALTLRGKKAPRFLYRGARGVIVHGSRAALSTALETLLLLARGCAGAGEMVRVQLAAAPRAEGQAEVVVDFPAGPLAELPPDSLLSGAPALAVGEVSAIDLAAAQAVVRALGGRIELSVPEPGSARLELFLPATVAAAPTPVAVPGAAGGA